MDIIYSGRNKLFNILFTIAIIWNTCIPGVIARFSPYAKAISLDAIPSLVFQKWKLTNYRRNEPIYQLKCVSGCEYEPDWIKCFNVHSPIDKGPTWRCQADLPSHLHFATLEVLCEGYESRDDKSILEGSCGLEYTLKHVAQSNIDLRTGSRPSNELNMEANNMESEWQWGTCQWLMLAIVIYVCCYCLYQVVQSDLKEALSTPDQKTIQSPVTGRCGKCQNTRFSSLDPIKEKFYSKEQSWQSDTGLEFQKPNEQATIAPLEALSPTSNNRIRQSYSSPPRSPCSPRGGFFRKLDRPLRCKKREHVDSPKI